MGKAEEILPELYEKEKVRADVIVVDPPRKGCEESLLETMVQMKPERIVYVSCDPATLARDLKYLCGEGYEMVRVRAVDQFPMTVHVESIVLLSHKSPDSTINVKVEFGEGVTMFENVYDIIAGGDIGIKNRTLKMKLFH